ncbi:hypothetical protein ACROSR_06445 [Roseovarius tibetensis]|uniref:hypothetical protein n=1 Tax=Roseovarius tibetensis TaxID=2685897 RepID=UPI003D7F81A0
MSCLTWPQRRDHARLATPCLVVAGIAGDLGFGSIAKIIFVIGLALYILAMIVRALNARHPV